MLKNYLTIATRNLRKQGFYSFINIAGLAVGVAACLVIVLYVVDELSYDSYNTKADRIYRVDNEIKIGSNNFQMAKSPAPAAQALQQDYPEIEATVRFCDYGTYLVRSESMTDNIKEQSVIWTDSTFFKIFSLKVLEGDGEKALREPASLAISKRTAEKYFPNESALGQSLILDNKYHGTVSAVYENIPSTSHFHFDILISMVGDWLVAREARGTLFSESNFNSYLLLKEGASAQRLEAKLPEFVKKYIASEEISTDKQASGNGHKMSLMPLRNIHLHSNLDGELEPNGSIAYVYLFATIAVFILAIACINFMNLSTARSANRAKEVGVRKVLGSLRSHLVRQFLTESTLVTFLAFILSVGLAYLFLPFFNDLSLKQLHLPLTDPVFYLILLATCLLIGIMAGVYPSFFLSAFKPVNVLKGKVSLGMKSGFVRSGLVVFQFVVTIFLIVGAMTVQRQLNFIQNKKLGFEKDQVIVLKDAYSLRPNIQTFKDEASKLSAIENITISGFIPIDGGSEFSRRDRTYWKEGNQQMGESLVNLQTWRCDYDYIKTLKMNIKEGRGFSHDFPSDSSAVVLNESAVLQLGLGDDPVGKRISTFPELRPNGTPYANQIITWTVIGVLENFHFTSMKKGISPLGLFIGQSDGFICLRYNAVNTQEVIQSLERIWKKIAPGQPFQFSFLNEEFGSMYAREQRLGKIFSVFATLAILIACLGLFALTAFTAEQRTKEIGIRKVLGASVSSIVVLLSAEFGKLILVAFLLAAPLAWFGVDWWLKSYTYKTEIGMIVYLLAGFIVLLIAWLTMSFQSFKAASSDPVKSLRSE